MTQSTHIQQRTLIIAGAVIAAFALLFGIDAIASAGRIHPGVRVGDAAVGGMDRRHAVSAVRSASAKLLAEPVKLSVAGRTWAVKAADIGAAADVTDAVDAAYAVGRSGEPLRSFGQRVSAWFGGQRLALRFTADDAASTRFFDAVSAKVADPGRDAAVVVEGTTARLVSARKGADLDRAAAGKALLAAFASSRRSVSLRLVASTPRVSDTAAAAALTDARKMLDGPVVLTYGSKRWGLTAAKVAGWIAFRAEPATGTPTARLTAYLASDEVSADVAPLLGGIGKTARDAGFKTSGGTVSIVPSEDGLALDAADLAKTLATRLVAGERTATIRMRRVEPAISTADAQAMGIKSRLSTFTTAFSAGNAPRVNNIHTLASALNGTLVAPGKTFSFNGTIGPRTAEKGYQEAPAIVNGELVPQLGGGICQVGTTVFNAVFFSGLPVVERHNHSEYISHYPTGRDATVSWGGPDLKFRNDTGHWVLVATSYTSSSITVSIYGTSTGYEVSYTTGPWIDIKPYATKTVKDPTLPVGAKVVETRGETGRSVVVKRTVTKAGAVVRTDSFKSVYKSSAEVVRVGTKVVPVTKKTTTTH